MVAADTVQIESSYPNKPSQEESKSRAVTDSKNGVVVTSEFVASSHYSIQDKLMKKSFATKVLHENSNFQFGHRYGTTLVKSNFYQQKP
jgi:hypothetical protein